MKRKCVLCNQRIGAEKKRDEKLNANKKKVQAAGYFSAPGPFEFESLA
jgi:hypothetical protein